MAKQLYYSGLKNIEVYLSKLRIIISAHIMKLTIQCNKVHAKASCVLIILIAGT